MLMLVRQLAIWCCFLARALAMVSSWTPRKHLFPHNFPASAVRGKEGHLIGWEISWKRRSLVISNVWSQEDHFQEPFLFNTFCMIHPSCEAGSQKALTCLGLNETRDRYFSCSSSLLLTQLWGPQAVFGLVHQNRVPPHHSNHLGMTIQNHLMRSECWQFVRFMISWSLSNLLDIVWACALPSFGRVRLPPSTLGLGTFCFRGLFQLVEELEFRSLLEYSLPGLLLTYSMIVPLFTGKTRPDSPGYKGWTKRLLTDVTRSAQALHHCISWVQGRFALAERRKHSSLLRGLFGIRVLCDKDEVED